MFRHAQSILISSALVVGIFAPPLSATVVDCIPEPGGTVPFDNPDLEGPGMPTSAEIAGATVWEQDPLSPDDAMGEGRVGNGATSVGITNTNGYLAGPNGATQNGGSEGDCIEVYVVWTIKYKYIVTKKGEIEFGGGISGGASSATEVWGRMTKRSKVKVICPC